MNEMSNTSSNSLNVRKGILFSTVVLALLMPAIYLVGTREFSVGTDTQNYVLFFQRSQQCKCVPEEMEFLFGLVALFAASITDNVGFFLGLISFIQFFLAIVLANVLGHYLKYDNSNYAFCFIFLSVLLVSPFFVSMQINVLRQGISALLVAVLAVFFKQKKIWMFSILAVVGTGFHYSTLMYLAVIPALSFSYKKIKWIFICMLLFYVTGFSEQIVRAFSDLLSLPLYQFLADYGGDSEYKSGVRFDFAAFSVFPWFVLAGMKTFQSSEVGKQRVEKIVSIYLVLLFPFLFFGWTSYSDRYAIGAWLLIPVFVSIAVLRFFNFKYLWLTIYFFLFSVSIFFYQLSNVEYWQ